MTSRKRNFMKTRVAEYMNQSSMEGKMKDEKEEKIEK